MRPGESGDGMNSQVVLRVGIDVAPDRVPGLSDMVWQTDPHLFGFLFGGDTVLWRRLFQQEWTADCGLHRGADTIVATTADMAVLGLLNAFPGHEADSRAEASFGRYLNSLDGPAAAQLSEAAEQMAWLFPPVPASALLVFNIVVAEAARGRGLGAVLLDAAEAQARRLGLAALHLDVDVGNPAVDFYRRHGFRAVVETRLANDGTAAVPAHFRMVRPLSD